MTHGDHDSTRWCAICQAYGDHHTDRCLNQDTAIGLPETWTLPVAHRPYSRWRHWLYSALDAPLVLVELVCERIRGRR